MRLLRLLMITCCSLSTTALVAADQVESAEAGQRPVEALAWQVYTIFSASCADCHGGHRSKPKGGFGHVLDLARLGRDPDYVMPGSPQDSELYRVLVDEDPDFLMPPPDSEHPPLRAEEIQAVHEWIAAGARLDTPPTVATPEPADEDVEQVEVVAAADPDAPSGFSFKRLFGHLHPLLVHLPIGLLLAAAGAGIVDRVRPRLWLDGAMAWCLWCGAVGSIAAVATGWVDAEVEGYADPTVWWHRWLGVGTMVLALAAAGLDGLGRLKARRRWRTIAFVLLLLAVLLVTITGHNGGVLVHGDDYLW